MPTCKINYYTSRQFRNCKPVPAITSYSSVPPASDPSGKDGKSESYVRTGKFLNIDAEASQCNAWLNHFLLASDQVIYNIPSVKMNAAGFACFVYLLQINYVIDVSRHQLRTDFKKVFFSTFIYILVLKTSNID